MRTKLTDEERKARKKANNARYRATPNGKTANSAYNTKWRATSEGMAYMRKYLKTYNANRYATPEGTAYRSAHSAQRNYGRAALFVADLLFRFQAGKCYLTGEPLVTPTIDHDHNTDLIRGLVNESANKLLGQQCGDSLVGCRQRLSRLKVKDGKLGTFIENAIPALMHTPAKQMGLEYRVTGRYASLPESRTNKGTIERANMLAIGAYMDRINNEMENAA